MHKLTVSLVTWNGGKYLPQCFESLLNQTFQDFSLVVLDNGSKDNSVEVIRQFADKFPGRFEFISKPENIGFARGHNLIMAANRAPYIMLLNQDIMLERQYFERCLEFLDQRPKIGAVSGKILKWIFPSVEAENGGLNKSQKSNIIDSLGLKIFRSQRVIERCVAQIDNGQFEANEEVFGVSGTVPIYRQAALDSVKFENEYFDEDFFSYKEDVDLSYRLRWAGWDIWLVAGAVAYHDRTASAHEELNLSEKISHRKKKSRLVNYNSYKNQWYLLIKNLSGANLLLNWPWIAAYELQKFIYALFFETSTLGSLGEVFRKLKRMGAKRKMILKNTKVPNKDVAKWFASK